MQFKWGWAAHGGTLAAVGLVGYFCGRIVAIPGTTRFWDIAAQPLATLFAGIGAITAGGLAFYNGHKSRELEADHHRESSTQEREANLRGRYTTAASQLADDNPAIREAGVYAIAALTDDWFRLGTSTGQLELAGSEQQVCVNLLCSYLRANRLVGEETGWDEETAELAVRATIVAVLRERLGTWKKQGVAAVNLSGAYLARAQMTEIDLSGADLSGACLSSAKLVRSNLERANLSDCDLSDTDFGLAQMHRAILAGVRGHETNFSHADLTAAIMASAVLKESDFENCQLVGANFLFADLEGSDVFKADFSDARLHSTNLRNVDFSTCNLTRARLDQSTNLDLSKLPSSDRMQDAELPVPENMPGNAASSEVT